MTGSAHNSVTADPFTIAADRLRRRQAFATPGGLANILTAGRELQAAHLDLIDQAWVDVEAGREDRVLILMAPRHGKSRRASRWGPLWYLRRHPRSRVMHVTHSAELAQSNGLWVRDQIASHPELGLTLSTSKATQGRWDLMTNDGEDEPGGMMSVGVGGTITGFGANILLVDDPHKDRREADSAAMRQHVHDWYTSTGLARLEPGGSVICLMQRWHEDDLAGRIIDSEGDRAEGGRWRVLRAPVTADEDDDLLGRALGVPLWPARYDLPALVDLQRAMGPRAWASQYQQKPQKQSGGIFEWLDITRNRVRLEDAPPMIVVEVVVDPSFADVESTGADETGVIVIGLGADGDLYVLADLSVRAPFEQAGIPAAAQAWNASRVGVERNLLGNRVLKDLRKQDRRLPLHPIDARGTKQLRAEQAAAMYRQGRVHHVGVHELLETQMTGWRPFDDDSPDRMDACVHGVHDLLLGKHAPSGPSRVHRPSGGRVPTGAEIAGSRLTLTGGQASRGIVAR